MNKKFFNLIAVLAIIAALLVPMAPSAMAQEAVPASTVPQQGVWPVQYGTVEPLESVAPAATSQTVTFSIADTNSKPQQFDVDINVDPSTPDPIESFRILMNVPAELTPVSIITAGTLWDGGSVAQTFDSQTGVWSISVTKVPAVSVAGTAIVARFTIASIPGPGNLVLTATGTARANEGLLTAVVQNGTITIEMVDLNGIVLDPAGVPAVGAQVTLQEVVARAATNGGTITTSLTGAYQFLLNKVGSWNLLLQWLGIFDMDLVVTEQDAYEMLLTSIGLANCPAKIGDLSNNGSTTEQDAYLALLHSVGLQLIAQNVRFTPNNITLTAFNVDTVQNIEVSLDGDCTYNAVFVDGAGGNARTATPSEKPTVSISGNTISFTFPSDGGSKVILSGVSGITYTTTMETSADAIKSIVANPQTYTAAGYSTQAHSIVYIFDPATSETIEFSAICRHQDGAYVDCGTYSMDLRPAGGQSSWSVFLPYTTSY